MRKTETHLSFISILTVPIPCPSAGGAGVKMKLACWEFDFVLRTGELAARRKLVCPTLRASWSAARRGGSAGRRESVKSPFARGTGAAFGAGMWYAVLPGRVSKVVMVLQSIVDRLAGRTEYGVAREEARKALCREGLG